MSVDRICAWCKKPIEGRAQPFVGGDGAGGKGKTVTLHPECHHVVTAAPEGRCDCEVCEADRARLPVTG